MPVLPLRGLLLATLVALGTAAFAAPAPAAASRPTTFELFMGQSTVSGYSANRASVHVVWRSAGGALKRDAVYTAAKRNGYWEAASDNGQVVRPGDTLQATVNGVKHRLVIPAFSIVCDQVKDSFHGKAPADSKVGLHYRSGDPADPWVDLPVRADTSGHWSYAPGFDITENIFAYARWHSAAGDVVTDNT